MKKYIIIALALICANMTFTSCDDVLNIEPTSKFSSSVVWGSESSLDSYVMGMYLHMKSSAQATNSNLCGFDDCYADLLKSGAWNTPHNYNVTMLQESSFTSDNAGAFENWGDCYYWIRRCNEFLRDKDSSSLPAEVVTPREAEVRLIRAFTYFELLRVYGRGVLRTELDGPDQNDKALSSESDCWNFVIDEMTWAAENLPEHAFASGRLSKAAGYGFLSRVALYAEDWATAVEAADSCKAHGGQLVSDYATCFNEGSCAENLFTIFYTTVGSMTHRCDVFFRPTGDAAAHDDAIVYGEVCPTSEYADEFEMADGTPFDWATHGADPYTGREPRFYASILYNGETWEGRQLQMYTGGADQRKDFECSGATNTTPTGYYFRKYITEGETAWAKNGSTHFDPMLRYAEVLLNKAEACAKLNREADALLALNEVRSRVNLPDVTASGDELMAAIRHERVVELGGEGFRFWDLRRWKLAVDVLHGKEMHGVNVTRNVTTDPESGEVTSETFTYNQIGVDGGRTRYFFERYYKFAIPLSERSNNALISETDNNPGW